MVTRLCSYRLQHARRPHFVWGRGLGKGRSRFFLIVLECYYTINDVGNIKFFDEPRDLRLGISNPQFSPYPKQKGWQLPPVHGL
jgi:hypothetical protein